MGVFDDPRAAALRSCVASVVVVNTKNMYVDLNRASLCYLAFGALSDDERSRVVVVVVAIGDEGVVLGCCSYLGIFWAAGFGRLARVCATQRAILPCGRRHQQLVRLGWRRRMVVPVQSSGVCSWQRRILLATFSRFAVAVVVVAL